MSVILEKICLKNKNTLVFFIGRLDSGHHRNLYLGMELKKKKRQNQERMQTEKQNRARDWKCKLTMEIHYKGRIERSKLTGQQHKYIYTQTVHASVLFTRHNTTIWDTIARNPRPNQRQGGREGQDKHHCLQTACVYCPPSSRRKPPQKNFPKLVVA